MTEVISPYFDFEPYHIDSSTTKFEYVEYAPRDDDMNKTDLIIETKDEDIYLLPHKAMLEIRGKMQKTADNTNYVETDIISLVNNAWSLFKSAEYQITNETVEKITDYLPEASIILNTVMFSDDYSKSTASNMFWFRDTGAGGPVFKNTMAAAAAVGNTQANINAALTLIINAYDANQTDPTGNLGFIKRQKLTTGDKQISLMIPLSSIFGFCKDVTTVFKGVKHTIKLSRADPSKYIMKNAAVDPGQFNINHISLWMPKVNPSLQIQAALDAMLVSDVKKDLYFEQVRVYRKMFQSTNTTPTWTITSLPGSQLPRHIFVALQSSERHPGANAQDINNMLFDNGNLRKIQVNVNSNQYPDKPIDCNFTSANRNYSMAYMRFLEAANKYQDTDTGCQISAEDWAGLYPIHHFDVSKHSDYVKSSTAEIQVTFELGGNFRNIANGGDVPYYVYAVVLSDRHMVLEGLSGKMNVAM